MLPCTDKDRLPADDNGSSSSDSDLDFLDDIEVLDAVRHSFPPRPHDFKTILQWGVGLSTDSLNAGLRYCGVSLDDYYHCTISSSSVGFRRLGTLNTQYHANRQVLSANVIRRCDEARSALRVATAGVVIRTRIQEKTRRGTARDIKSKNTQLRNSITSNTNNTVFT